MKHASELIKNFESEQYNELLTDIYVDEHLLAYQNGRYIAALQKFIKDFGDTEVSIFSAPGRSEVGGNHTDHQHGQVLAASINLDAIAIVAKTSDDKIQVISDGYDLITIDASDLSLVESEKETTTALIKGVAAGLKEHGHAVGGFKAYITSDVLIGAGLSSSAAFETLIRTILSAQALSIEYKIQDDYHVYLIKQHLQLHVFFLHRQTSMLHIPPQTDYLICNNPLLK